MDVREIGWCVMDWIDLVKNKDQWKTLAETAMDVCGP
jgi:hypothetical protein